MDGRAGSTVAVQVGWSAAGVGEVLWEAARERKYFVVSSHGENVGWKVALSR